MGLVDRAALALAARTPRRRFLTRTAVVASALVVAPKRFVFEPVSADDAVCGTGNTCGTARHCSNDATKSCNRDVDCGTGNTCVAKPSELAPATSKALTRSLATTNRCRGSTS